MDDKNFILIQGWMRTKLKLSGAELLIYAIIHNFSQDGIGTFDGTYEYLAEWIGASRRTVIYSINSLLGKGLISKKLTTKNNITFNSFQAVQKMHNPTNISGKNGTWGTQKLPAPCANSALPPMQKLHTNNNIDTRYDKNDDNDSDNIILKQQFSPSAIIAGWNNLAAQSKRYNIPALKDITPERAEAFARTMQWLGTDNIDDFFFIVEKALSTSFYLSGKKLVSEGNDYWLEDKLVRGANFDFFTDLEKMRKVLEWEYADGTRLEGWYQKHPEDKDEFPKR